MTIRHIAPWLFNVAAGIAGGVRIQVETSAGALMKRRYISLIAAVLFAGGTLPVFAQDVDPTGTWDLMFSTQQGAIGAQMIISKDGTAYGGSISSELGQAPIQAAVKGNAVTVGFAMTTGGGDQLAVTMNATITGDEIKGSYDAGGSGSGEFTGTWIVQVTTPDISASPTVVLKQEGEKLTGEYQSTQYGSFPIEGTIKDGKIEFGFTMNIEGNSVATSFSGTAEKDSLKGNVAYGDFAQGTFTATKKQ
jgi:hypothetical protein